MNIGSIAHRNVRVRALSSALTTVSVALGAALVASLWLMIDQTEQRYKSSLAGYEAIVGPKEGSPLSLVLSTVMNLGVQPGVVPMSVYRELRDGDLSKRFGVRYAIPQARGDYYGGFPIVGTTDEWFSLFARGKDSEGEPRRLEFDAGGGWTFSHEDFVEFADTVAAELTGDGHDVEHTHDDADADHDHADEAGGHAELPAAWRQAVVGARVAEELGLTVGSPIVPSHGREDEVAHVHDEAESEIVGVLAPTGTPIDRSIYVPMSLFLSIEGHDAMRPDAQEVAAGNLLISAIVVDARHRMAGPWLRREFQTRDDAQVAWPQIEIAQLLQMVGNAADVLRVIAWLVVVVAAIGVCVALYNTMNERRREIAIMRSLGARRLQILSIILIEATLLSFGGAVAGVFLAHGAAWAFGGAVAAVTSVTVDWAAFSLDELWLILGVTVLGAVAGIVPAVKGSTTEVAENLGPVS